MAKSKTVTKAVFPVAGMGTRFLPATKASPKEMLPIVDKPLIQFAVEEAIAAGATQLIFVTSSVKRSIEDHFDSHYELEAKLQEKNKLDLLEKIKNIVPPHVTCVYVRQQEALGLGHAVLCAKDIIGDAPFMVSLADDLIYHPENNCLTEMLKVYQAQNSCVVGVKKVPQSDISQYGVIDFSGELDSHVAIKAIVEKPEASKAPSDYGVTGRYVLTPEIFEHLATIGKGSGGEIQLTDAIAALLKNKPVHAMRIEGKRYDCGSKLGYLQATVEYGLRHPKLGEDFAAYLSQLDFK